MARNQRTTLSDFAGVIIAFRRKRRINQTELAAISNILQPRISRLESGDTAPNARDILGLCKVMNHEPDILLALLPQDVADRIAVNLLPLKHGPEEILQIADKRLWRRMDEETQRRVKTLQELLPTQSLNVLINQALLYMTLQIKRGGRRKANL